MRISALRIENFRGIESLSLENLQDTVVIAGPNGCGKTQVYHAIRLMKSTYGGYQPNESAQWWGEFNIRIDQTSRDVLRLFRDRTKPVTFAIDFQVTESERDFLRSHATDLLLYRVWAETAPDARRGLSPISIIASARNQRLFGPEVERKVEAEAVAVRNALQSTELRGAITLTPDLRRTYEPNPALELLFGTYSPNELGLVDYHGAQRNYAREQLGNIDLNIRSAEDRFSSRTLYNVHDKYSNVKSELAAAYVRGLIAQQAGTVDVTVDSLTDTLKLLFATFFPGKEFKGPTPGPDGTLDFPVWLADGSEHDIDDLSSGEKEVLFGYLRLRNHAPKNSVILIDEPELHLNPALLRGFPQFYHEHIGKLLNNQLWLVTHSDTLLRQAVDQPGFSVFHMQPSTLSGTRGNQAVPLKVGDTLEQAVLDLVGDLAAYRPGAKVVFFEGGGLSDFDVQMTSELFPDFAQRVNMISVGTRSNVDKLHLLLRKVETSGAVGARFFSVVDRDAAANREVIGSFAWDRYHIENYLLSANHVHSVIHEVHGGCPDPRVSSIDGVERELKACAAQCVSDLVRNSLESFANQQLLTAIKTGSARDGAPIADSLRDAIENSGQRFRALVDVELSVDKLSQLEKHFRERLQLALTSDDWKKEIPGRTVLRTFAGSFVPGLKYEVFRNLILARMRDSKEKPPGMSAVLSEILRDNTSI